MEAVKMTSEFTKPSSGASAKALYALLTSDTQPDSYPHDADDWGRCAAVISGAEPETVKQMIKSRCNDVTLAGAVWHEIAVNLTELSCEGANIDALIKRIVRPIEDASGRVGRIEGVSGSLTFSQPANTIIMPKKTKTESEEKMPKEETVAGALLKSFLERIERLEEEKKGLSADIKDVFCEAKGVGFDTKTMRRILKLRKMDDDKLREESELLQLYAAAIGLDQQLSLF